MKDRVPKYPGRVELTPVPGQVNKYDMKMADEPTEAGTPPTKANLLSDETASALGLAGNAVVDEALRKINQGALTLGRYYWKRYTHSVTLENGSVQFALPFKITGSVSSEVILYYANTIHVADGKTPVIELDQPIRFGLSYASAGDTEIRTLNGKYFRVGNADFGQVYFVTDDGDYIHQHRPDPNSYGFQKNHYTVSLQYTDVFLDMLFSANEAAYPNGVQGGYRYEALGSPSLTKIVTGSYVGTGAYGTSSPNSLIIPDGAIAYVRMAQIGSSSVYVPTDQLSGYFIPVYCLTENWGSYNQAYSGSAGTWMIRKTGNRFEWYNTTSPAGNQDNASGVTYHYAWLIGG